MFTSVKNSFWFHQYAQSSNKLLFKNLILVFSNSNLKLLIFNIVVTSLGTILFAVAPTKE